METRSLTHAVCGFYFSPDRKRLALIRKRKPAWQEGKLNGVGGKMEPAESKQDAMVREFAEETGTTTTTQDWELFFTLDDYDHNFRVHYFRAVGDVDTLRSMEEEQVEVVPVDPLPQDMIHNLSWLVPMALDLSFWSGNGHWKSKRCFFTIGCTKSYDQALREEEVVRKLGKRDDPNDPEYVGGIVWSNLDDAREGAEKFSRDTGRSFSVYEVSLPGPWEQCVYVAETGTHHLLVSATIRRKVI